MKKDIDKNIERKGISFSPYFHTALRFYDMVLDAEKVLVTKEKELQDEYSDYGVADFKIAIYSSTRKEFSQLNEFSTATQIFSCMAIESFLNFYGVNQLGEDFYKRNFERLSSNQKPEALIAVSVHLSLEKDDEICKVVRRMFDQRNRLVHPKAKQIEADSERIEIIFGTDNPVSDAKKMVDDMRLFFDLFRKLDPSHNSLIDYLTKEDLQ
jgi:hypothetical protein